MAQRLKCLPAMQETWVRGEISASIPVLRKEYASQFRLDKVSVFHRGDFLEGKGK